MQRQKRRIDTKLCLAGVVDDNIDRPKRRFNVVDQSRDHGRIREVGGFGEALPRAAAEFFKALENTIRGRGDGDLGARRSEQRRGGETDGPRTARTGHQGNPASNTRHAITPVMKVPLPQSRAAMANAMMQASSNIRLAAAIAVMPEALS